MNAGVLKLPADISKELKEKIIAQMLRCDMELTKFAEEKILK